MRKQHLGKDMQKIRFNNKLLWQAANLIVSMLPALVVGIFSLERPVLVMGSDQDLMWASEAMRLLRGAGPSYADHPGAFWGVTYAVTIKALSVLTPYSIIKDGNLTAKGLELLILAIRIESSVLAGLAGYMCSQILSNLRTQELIVLGVTFLIASSSPILFSATAIRHEVISMILLMGSCVTMQALFANEKTSARATKAISSVLLIFLASFSKQQSLIALPFFAWIALITNRLDHPIETRLWLEKLRKLKSKGWGIVLTSCGIIWLISATPDIDLINLPFWMAINFLLFSIISAAFVQEQTHKAISKAILALALLEILLTRIISSNWWRQAVTGFPSWLLMFNDHSQKISANKPSPLEGLAHYFESIFAFPKLAILASCITVGLSVILYVDARKKNTAGITIPANNFKSAPGWIITAIVTGICLARINLPYTIYFLPCIAICCCISLKEANCSNKGFTAMGRRAVGAMSVFLLSVGFVRSAQNLTTLHQISQSGLPKESICMGHNMDPSMRFTPVGQCPDFQNQSRQKEIFDPWWTGPR
jgi:hypothetical protein